MVFFNSEDLPWSSFVRAWAKRYRVPYVDSQYICDALLQYLPKTVDFYFTQLKSIVPLMPLQVVQQVCSILEAMRGIFSDFTANTTAEDIKQRVNMVVAFAFVWGAGGSCDAAGGERFDTFLRDR